LNVTLVNHLFLLLDQAFIDLVLDDGLCHSSVVIALQVEKLAKYPAQVLRFLRRQVFSLNQIVDDDDLLRLDGKEEVAQREVVVHHVSEERRLAFLQSLDELGRFLNELEDCLVFLVLLAEGSFVLRFRHYQVV
jgi:hypothetical protein